MTAPAVVLAKLAEFVAERRAVNCRCYCWTEAAEYDPAGPCDWCRVEELIDEAKP